MARWAARTTWKAAHPILRAALHAPPPSARRHLGIAPCQARRHPRHLEEGSRALAAVCRGGGLRVAHWDRLGGSPRQFRRGANGLSPLSALGLQGGIWDELFIEGIPTDAIETVMLDRSTACKAQRFASGARGGGKEDLGRGGKEDLGRGGKEDLGRSQGGLTTKL